MVARFNYEFKDGVLELVSLGHWELNKDFENVTNQFLELINTTKPKALLWKSQVRKKMGLDMAMKFSIILNQIEDKMFMAYVSDVEKEEYDIRNYTITKKVASLGNVVGEIFYDEYEAREWLKQKLK